MTIDILNNYHLLINKNGYMYVTHTALNAWSNETLLLMIQEQTLFG